MPSSKIHINLLLEMEPTGQFIRDLFEYCFVNGVSTQQSGSTETCEYIGPVTDWDFRPISTAEAIDEIASGGDGTMNIYYADIDLLFGIFSESDEVMPDVPCIWLSAPDVYFKPRSKLHTAAEAQANVDSYIELVRLLADYASPFYGCGLRTRLEDDRFPLTVSPADLTEGKIDEWFWLNILHPEAIKNIGRERIFTAPAWRIDELSDGSVMIIASANPRDLDATERGKEAIREHFGFGG